MFLPLKDVADPSNISLRDAVYDLQDTIKDSIVRSETAPYKTHQAGMYLDEATVTFNVSAKQNNGGGLSVSPAAGVVPIGGTLSGTLASEGNRGNQITMTFKNAATLKGGGSSAEATAAQKKKLAEMKAKCVAAAKTDADKKSCDSLTLAVAGPGPFVFMSEKLKVDPAYFSRELEQFKTPSRETIIPAPGK